MLGLFLVNKAIIIVKNNMCVLALVFQTWWIIIERRWTQKTLYSKDKQKDKLISIYSLSKGS